jgi:phosphoglycolate phosphatase
MFLFDLDGVLIDSKKNMKFSWQDLIKKHKIKVPFNKYFSLIGAPFLKILEKLNIENSNYKIIEKDYKKNSNRYMNLIRIHKGVKKTINTLKQKKKYVGILTSKEKSRTLKILKKYNINVDVVLCPYKNLIGKPNPKQINDLSKKTKISKNQIVFIGDMKIDKITAKNAKIDYIQAKYGYSKKLKSKYSINKINDIITNNLGVS